MANTIEMPKLSDTMTTGTLVKWLKKEGDAVKNGDMLAEVETDKATMELESFFDGILLKIFTPAGSQVEVGAPLCVVGEKGEKVDAPAAAPKPPAATESKAEAKGGPRPPGEGKPATKAPTEADEGRARPPGGPDSTPDPAEANEKPAEPSEKPKAAPAAAAGASRLRISPLARKLAEEKGIDPSRIQGSGPGGRIVRADLASAGKAPAAARPSRTGPGPIQEDKAIPVSNMRATIARRLVESKTRLPHFYIEVEIDAQPMVDIRAQLNGGLESEGVKLSLNDFILKACAEALRLFPAANRSWEAGESDTVIRQHGSAHVSFAVAVEDGLITPVIRDAQNKSLFDISKEARSLAELARNRKLQPAQFTGGTFCVSNLGMKGIDRFYAIINPPNAAILAVGAVLKKPVVAGDKLAIGQRLSLALSCDHRVINGAEAADFLIVLKDILEKPALLLV